MKPVDQNRFGYPDGNCFAACLASLLEVSLDAIPDFTHATNWWLSVALWLRPRGLYPVSFNCESADISDAWVPEGLHILNGRSPRGEFDHSVVAAGREIVHDPHPSRAGLASQHNRILLVPLDPKNSQSKC